MPQKSTFSLKSWDETTLLEDPKSGHKHTRVEAKKQYKGQLEGESELYYLLAYESETRGVYTGYESFVGSFDGKDGSAVFAHQGTFVDNVIEEQSQVITSMGQGELAGWQATIHFRAPVTEGETEVTIQPQPQREA